MYEKFFGFHERPFSLAPDPRFLLMTERHQAAATMLDYGLASEAPISVLTGEVGSGKTTLTRHLIAGMGPQVTVGVINQTHRNSGRLLLWAALALGIEVRGSSATASYRAFARFIAVQRDQGRRVLLVVDEAQNLGPTRLEELRILSNVNDNGGMDLQLLLVGQPELRVTMARPKLRQLAQRVAVECNLTGLTRDETHAYVRHRLTVAGGRGDLFSAGAVDLAYMHSAGIPRLVNQLCDRALVYAFADQQSNVGSGHLDQVVRDRLEGGIFPDAASAERRSRRRIG
jgi:general secretion pathway protein A